MSEWKPIETAPKDGSHILVCRWPLIVSTNLDMFCHNVCWWGKENDGDGAWVIYNDQIAEAYCFFDPTHWMPIPAPPGIPSLQQQIDALKAELEALKDKCRGGGII